MIWTDRALAETIINYTSAAYGFTPSDITGRAKDPAVAHSRQVAMHLIRELTDLSYPQIGHLLGDRCHTTIIHGCRRIKDQMPRRPTLRANVAELTATVTGFTTARAAGQ